MPLPRRPALPVAPALLALALGLCLPETAMSVPPDPMRPLAEETCEEATRRLAEALRSSALISAAEHAQLVARLRADALRLCGRMPDEDELREALPVAPDRPQPPGPALPPRRPPRT